MRHVQFIWQDYALRFEVRNEGTDEAVLEETFKHNIYNLGVTDFLQSGIMIDIGANIGSQCVLAKLLGAKHVVAYEPEPENRLLLRKNIRLNRVKVDVHKEAVWSSETTIPLLPLQGDTTSNVQKIDGHGDQVIQVPTVTLDQVLEPFEEVDVLKVDTEGAEYEIFRESQSIDKARTIMLEFHHTTKEEFGALVATLVLTHNVQVYGKWTGGGGQLFARRYH